MCIKFIVAWPCMVSMDPTSHSQGLRCDRCFDKHLRCNRAFPKCDNCSVQFNAKCTYSRKVQKKGGKRIAYNERLMVIDFRKANSESNVVLSQHRADLQPLRTYINLTMTFLQYPRIASYIPLLISIAKRYQIFVQSPGKSKALEENITMTPKFKSLFQKAEFSFFENANNFISLFPKDIYYSRYRSVLLREAILCCGISWHKTDPLFPKAESHLVASIIKNTLPSKMSMNLDTLQALLIIMLCMFGKPWVNCRVDFYSETALRIATAIGLHISSPLASADLELERQLARNCLSFYTFYLFMNMQSTPLALPESTVTLKPTLEFTILFSHGLTQIIELFPEILRIKAALVEISEINSASHIEHLICSLEDRLNTLSLDYMIQLYTFARRVPSCSSQLLSLVNVYNFYHSFYAFFLSSLRIYQTTASLVPTLNGEPSEDAVHNCITLCIRTIRWALRIERNQIHLFFVAMLSQCLIFLYQNRNLVSPVDRNLLDLGLALSQISSRIPVFRNCRFETIFYRYD
ncbi:hypothetical protein DSO57_1028194 [Entomophthora muscae]|uniref:Uncharacterized protein n=1 Tax=Entomophthora muscae TaxID=34485 RepID=A0ACC2S3B9_9FUNG|nr:hypothetical protein DSO57_1028194 [Entomophthora muscae]